jgi:WD40 repeat protein
MENRVIVATVLVVAALVVGLTRTSDAQSPKNETPGEPSKDLNGDLLPYPAVARFGTARLRHGQWVRSVAFSPDGKELASSSYDGMIRFWDPMTGNELRRFPKRFDSPARIAYVNGGKELLVVEGTWYDSTGPKKFRGIQTWDVATGNKLVRTVGEQFGNPFEGKRVNVSPRGDRVAFGSGATVLVFDTEKADAPPIGVAVEGVRDIAHVAFSVDSKLLSVGAILVQEGPIDREKRPSVIRVYALPSGKQIWERKGVTGNANGAFPAAEFSPDGKFVAASFSHKEQMALLDAPTGETVRPFAGKAIGYWPFKFTADGAKLYVNIWGDTDEIWDVQTGKVFGAWARNNYSVFGLALSPDGKTMASAESRKIRLMIAETGKPALADVGVSETVEQIELLPDGRRLLAGGHAIAEAGFTIWDRQTGRKLFDYSKRATSFSLAPDGKTLALCNSGNPPPSLFDLDAMKVVRESPNKRTESRWLSYSPDASRILARSWFENKIHEIDPGTMVSRLWMDLPNEDRLAALEFFPKGNRIAIALTGPRHDAREPIPAPAAVEIWDLAEKRKIRSLTGLLGTFPLIVAVSPDGRRVAAASAETRFISGGPADARVIVWDSDTGERLATLPGSANGHRCVAFSPDGRTVAAGGEDHRTYVWELATGTVRAEFVGHEGPVSAVKFTPDSRTLFTGSSDTTVLEWNLVALPKARTDTTSAWAALTATDGMKAHHAMRTLLSTPADTVAMLSKRLKKAPLPDEAAIKKLIIDLDSPVFGNREAASKELVRIGQVSLPFLREAARDQSLEVSRRANKLIQMLNPYSLSGEALEQVRSLEMLECIATPEARRLLGELAEGGRGHLLTEEATTILGRWPKK